MRTLWPAYLWRDDELEWTQALAALKLGDIAIINPASGPGTELFVVQQQRIAQMQALGIAVAGYVTTANGGKPWRDAVAEAARYRELGYSIEAIFWDETSTFDVQGAYRGLHGYSRSLKNPASALYAQGFSIFNLGEAHSSTTRDMAKVLSGSIWVTFENDAKLYNPPDLSNEAHLVYDTGANTAATLVKAKRAGVGYCYATPDTLDNPWDSWEGDG